MRQKAAAPASVRKEPVTFCSTLTMRIPLRLVIVKRHNEAVQEGQHRPQISVQAVKQKLRDQFIPLGHLLTQHAILLFQPTKSFLCSHTGTLHIFRLLGKSLGNLSGYNSFSHRKKG